MATQVSSLQAEVSSLQSSQTSLAGLASVNRPPIVLPVKLAWCTETVGQDRFCPNIITVDLVQVFFSNDTAAHTFTMTGSHDFQINDSAKGLVDFLQNYSPIPGDCSNSGTYVEISAGASRTLHLGNESPFECDSDCRQ